MIYVKFKENELIDYWSEKEKPYDIVIQTETHHFRYNTDHYQSNGNGGIKLRDDLEEYLEEKENVNLGI